MKNPFLIGKKVYLRSLERADAPIFVQWMNDPEIQRFTLRARPINLQDEEEYIERVRTSPNDVVLLILARESDSPVGVVALHDIDWRSRHASFGLTIGEPSQWGKGYGSEATQLMVQHAFATLNLNRVWLIVLDYNQRGLRCYEKAGFKKEGLLKQEYYRDGKYWDSWLMAVLREEWAASKNEPEA